MGERQSCGDAPDYGSEGHRTCREEKHMAKKSIGAKVWLIADSFLPDQSTGEMKSHEAACVLNVSRRPAKLKITVYFEDREPLKGLEAVCPAQRTAHVHLEEPEEPPRRERSPLPNPWP